MRLFLRVLLVVSLSLGFIAGAQAAVKRQEIAPDFQLPDLQQQVLTLSAYRDKQLVLLFFWTTWCPYCRRGLKELNERYPELSEKGWQVLAVNIGEPQDKVKRFIDNYVLQFKVLLDQNLSAAEAYDVLGVPTYALIDKSGMLVFQDNYFPLEQLEGLALQ
ncbi:MAG: redoxin domain-containing protein [Candidatus Omnitrophota bacterium]